MPTQDKHLFHTRSTGQINLPTHQLINSSTQKNKKSTSTSTQKLKTSPTHQLSNSPTLKLKLLYFILQYRSSFRSVLAKIQAIKQANSPYFQLFTPPDMFNFKKKTCVLYHLAFLDWLNARNILSPSTRFQPLKSYFLTTILPFSAMFLMSLKVFVYTIAVDIYAFCLAFSAILPCVLHQNALHLAAKRTAFSTKTQCIQHQNAVRLAANCPKSGANGGLFK